MFVAPSGSVEALFIKKPRPIPCGVARERLRYIVTRPAEYLYFSETIQCVISITDRPGCLRATRCSDVDYQNRMAFDDLIPYPPSFRQQTSKQANPEKLRAAACLEKSIRRAVVASKRSPLTIARALSRRFELGGEHNCRRTSPLLRDRRRDCAVEINTFHSTITLARLSVVRAFLLSAVP